MTTKNFYSIAVKQYSDGPTFRLFTICAENPIAALEHVLGTTPDQCDTVFDLPKTMPADIFKYVTDTIPALPGDTLDANRGFASGSRTIEVYLMRCNKDPSLSAEQEHESILYEIRMQRIRKDAPCLSFNGRSAVLNAGEVKPVAIEAQKKSYILALRAGTRHLLVPITSTSIEEAIENALGPLDKAQKRFNPSCHQTYLTEGKCPFDGFVELGSDTDPTILYEAKVAPDIFARYFKSYKDDTHKMSDIGEVVGGVKHTPTGAAIVQYSELSAILNKPKKYLVVAREHGVDRIDGRGDEVWFLVHEDPKIATLWNARTAFGEACLGRNHFYENIDDKTKWTLHIAPSKIKNFLGRASNPDSTDVDVCLDITDGKDGNDVVVYDVTAWDHTDCYVRNRLNDPKKYGAIQELRVTNHPVAGLTYQTCGFEDRMNQYMIAFRRGGWRMEDNLFVGIEARSPEEAVGILFAQQDKYSSHTARVTDKKEIQYIIAQDVDDRGNISFALGDREEVIAHAYCKPEQYSYEEFARIFDAGEFSDKAVLGFQYLGSKREIIAADQINDRIFPVKSYTAVSNCAVDGRSCYIIVEYHAKTDQEAIHILSSVTKFAENNILQLVVNETVACGEVGIYKIHTVMGSELTSRFMTHASCDIEILEPFEIYDTFCGNPKTFLRNLPERTPSMTLTCEGESISASYHRRYDGISSTDIKDYVVIGKQYGVDHSDCEDDCDHDQVVIKTRGRTHFDAISKLPFKRDGETLFLHNFHRDSVIVQDNEEYNELSLCIDMSRYEGNTLRVYEGESDDFMEVELAPSHGFRIIDSPVMRKGYCVVMHHEQSAEQYTMFEACGFDAKEAIESVIGPISQLNKKDSILTFTPDLYRDNFLRTHTTTDFSWEADIFRCQLDEKFPIVAYEIDDESDYEDFVTNFTTHADQEIGIPRAALVAADQLIQIHEGDTFMGRVVTSKKNFGKPYAKPTPANSRAAEIPSPTLRGRSEPQEIESMRSEVIRREPTMLEMVRDDVVDGALRASGDGVVKLTQATIEEVIIPRLNNPVFERFAKKAVQSEAGKVSVGLLFGYGIHFGQEFIPQDEVRDYAVIVGQHLRRNAMSKVIGTGMEIFGKKLYAFFKEEITHLPMGLKFLEKSQTNAEPKKAEDPVRVEMPVKARK